MITISSTIRFTTVTWLSTMSNIPPPHHCREELAQQQHQRISDTDNNRSINHFTASTPYTEGHGYRQTDSDSVIPEQRLTCIGGAIVHRPCGPHKTLISQGHTAQSLQCLHYQDQGHKPGGVTDGELSRKIRDKCGPLYNMIFLFFSQ